MNQILVALGKDWLRAIRKPWPWVIFLVLPIALTFIMGAAFGGNGKSATLPVIHVLVVDEDLGILAKVIDSISRSTASPIPLKIEWIPSQDARGKFSTNRYAAWITLPEGWSQAYLSGTQPPLVRVIKNPAQTILPNVVEELFRDGLQRLAVMRSPLEDQLPAIARMAGSGQSLDLVSLAPLLMTTSSKLDQYNMLFRQPPLTLEQVRPTTKNNTPLASSHFAILLPMMAAFFLYFNGEMAMRDIYREYESQTMQRFRAQFGTVTPVILSKWAFSFSLVLMSGLVLIFGGGWIFGISWPHPATAFLLCAAYAFFMSGFSALLVAVFNQEKRLQLWSQLIIFSIAFSGGSILDVSILPGWIQTYISPYLPNFWFISAMHSSQLDRGDYPVTMALTNLIICGGISLGVALIRLNKLVSRNRFQVIAL